MPRFLKARPGSCNSGGFRVGKFPFFPSHNLPLIVTLYLFAGKG